MNSTELKKRRLIGPFTQALTLEGLGLYGALPDEQLKVIHNAGVIVKGTQIERIETWNTLFAYAQNENIAVERIESFFESKGQSCPKALTLTPGLIDAHTHICYAGSRARDYADRLNGVSYETIAQRGGGIRDTMRHTRLASEDELVELNQKRLHTLLNRGVTTVEIKSGYGLSVQDELKQLRAIKRLGQAGLSRVVPTCLAAHVLPPEFQGQHESYLQEILQKLLPLVKEENLAKRIDAFIEPSAFPVDVARTYLQQAKAMGFQLTIHADQFSTGGAQLAAELKAQSADHLEASRREDLLALQQAKVSAVALPGASLGLGIAYTPAREALDLGLSLAIASDWNPGSAPMGHLLLQASVLGAAEKLSAAEVWAGITSRAAHALGLNGIGQLSQGFSADMLAFEADDYREILYQQGMLNPQLIWTQGRLYQSL